MNEDTLNYVVLNKDSKLKFGITTYNEVLPNKYRSNEYIEFHSPYKDEARQFYYDLPGHISSIDLYDREDQLLMARIGYYIKEATDISLNSENQFTVHIVYTLIN